MKNQQIAELLREMADFLEMMGTDWKPRAYRLAAQSIEGLNEDIEQLAQEGRLTEITGVGKSIAEKICEWLKTGCIKELSELRKRIPVDVQGLMRVEGLGPKKIKKLYETLNIKNVSDLEQAARKGQIARVEGMGQKSQETILRAVGFTKSAGKRVLYSQALPVAEELMVYLKKTAPLDQIAYAGSLRRGRSTIGDIDILVTSDQPKKVSGAFVGYKEVSKILAKGETKSSVVLAGGMQVDLRVVSPDKWGAALLYFTGSKQHNIALRKMAISLRLKLSEYGLFRGKSLIASRTEKDMYNSLGLSYIEPEIREDEGEIEAAQNNGLPKLLSFKDLKGDFHMHTNASDGTHCIEEMVESAKKLGLSFGVITDHTGQLQIAGGLRGKELMDHIKQVRRVAQSLKGFTLFAGAEVNITDKGELDIDSPALNRLDVVVGSIHSGFKNEKEHMTKRMCTAMEHPKMHILGHPTGRLLNVRPGYDFDVEAVFSAAKRTGTALELDSQPHRMDLPTPLLRRAKENKIMIAISSDAHSKEQTSYLKYGVVHARRGWLQAKDVLNTLSAREVRLWAKKKEQGGNS